MLKGLSVVAAFMLLLSSFEGCNLNEIIGTGTFPDDMDGFYVGSMRYIGTDETSSLDMEVLGRDVAIVEVLNNESRKYAGDFVYDSDEGEFEATLTFEEYADPLSDSVSGGPVPDTLGLSGQFELDSLVITGDFTVIYADESSAAGTWTCEQETGPS
ncbi:MAG: hypothetical protein JSW52_07050 [Candidatus Coatesbacteria bacterium]|nr:MAG: hypothetical protein JSW52_07050 [Candidatus Coatesbacteria bacterium]